MAQRTELTSEPLRSIDQFVESAARPCRNPARHQVKDRRLSPTQLLRMTSSKLLQLVPCWSTPGLTGAGHAAWSRRCWINLRVNQPGRYKIAKLNIDENPRTAAQFNIRSIPTLLIFKNGNLVDQIIGAQPKQAIAARLATHTHG